MRSVRSRPASLPIVCAQNGVANEPRALRIFEHVHGMCVKMPSVYLKPGVVSVHGAPFYGTCDLGRFPSGYDRVDETFAADLSGTSIHCAPRDDIMGYKYAKLVSNLGNVIEGGVRHRRLERRHRHACPRRSDGRLRGGARQDGAECVARIRARAPWKASSVPAARRIRVSHGAPRTSRTDDLNGEIVFLGRLHGVPTPVNAMLQRLAVRLVNEHVAPGSMTLADLERAI